MRSLVRDAARDVDRFAACRCAWREGARSAATGGFECHVAADCRAVPGAGPVRRSDRRFFHLLNFFYARRLPLRKVPVELEAPPFAVGVVTLKGRMVSPVAQLFLDQARDMGSQLTKRQTRYAGRVPE